MPAYVNLIDSASANAAAIDANKQLAVALAPAAANAGFAKILDSNGAPIITTENGALDVSIDSVLLFEQVDGAALNTNIWTTSASILAIAQASGFITLNSGAAVTANGYAILQSIKSIPFYGYLPLKVAITAAVATQAQTNATVELGIGAVATTASPTDGCFFRWAPTGALLCVVSYGGAETTAVSTITPAINDQSLFEIILVEDLVQFLIDDVIAAEIDNPQALAFPTSAGRLPIVARVYNASVAPSAAPKLSIGQVIVVQQATNQNRNWSETLVSMGRGASQSPVTPFAQIANNANSAAPASATLSNTAAGYTTLGGRFQFAAVNGAATDYALFGFQVPAGYQFFLTGASVSLAVTGAAIVTATVLDWSLGLNASAVSLATADGAGTWAPRRVALGMQAMAALAGIGAMPPDIVRAFTPSLVVDGGRFVHVILQIPSGANTLSLVFRGSVAINGYFE